MLPSMPVVSKSMCAIDFDSKTSRYVRTDRILILWTTWAGKPFANHGKTMEKCAKKAKEHLPGFWQRPGINSNSLFSCESWSRVRVGKAKAFQSLLNHQNHWQFIDIMTELIKRMCELMIYVSTDLTRSICWNRSANCEILVGHPQKWPESLKQQKLKDRTRKACKKSKLVTFGNTFAFCPTWLLQHTNSLHGYNRSKLMLWLCCCVVLLVVYSRKKVVLFDACLRAVARDASSQTCWG